MNPKGKKSRFQDDSFTGRNVSYRTEYFVIATLKDKEEVTP